MLQTLQRRIKYIGIILSDEHILTEIWKKRVWKQVKSSNRGWINRNIETEISNSKKIYFDNSAES